jgi:hypothetical protein
MPSRSIEKYQIEVMGILGYTVVMLQKVEQVLKYCWLAYAKREGKGKDKYFLYDGDLDELFDSNNEKTLGRLLLDIKKSGQFRASFIRKFEDFLRRRNRVIHHIFHEKRYDIHGNRRALQRLHKFLSKLFVDAGYYESVFDAYLGVMYECLAKQEGVHMKGVDGLKRLNDIKRKRGDFERLFLVWKR